MKLIIPYSLIACLLRASYKEDAFVDHDDLNEVSGSSPLKLGQVRSNLGQVLYYHLHESNLIQPNIILVHIL